MSKQFNEHDFTCWKQDNTDQSNIDTIPEFLNQQLLLSLKYCKTVLGMSHNVASLEADKFYQSELKRMKESHDFNIIVEDKTILDVIDESTDKNNIE